MTSSGRPLRLAGVVNRKRPPEGPHVGVRGRPQRRQVRQHRQDGDRAGRQSLAQRSCVGVPGPLVILLLVQRRGAELPSPPGPAGHVRRQGVESAASHGP